CKEVFKHVKWHTVADFINEMETVLVEIGAKINDKPDLNAITKVTHNENNNSNTKIIISFKYKDAVLYIANDKLNGFTLGNIVERKWNYFSENIKDIKFSDFSKKQTFDLINDQKRNDIIIKMVQETELLYKSLSKSF